VDLAFGTLIVAAALGLASSRSPLLGIGLPLAALYATLALYRLEAAVVVFILLSFFQLIPGIQGSSLTIVKLAGLALAGAWVVRLLDRRGTTPSLLRDHPALALAAAGFWTWGLASSLWAIETQPVYTYSWRVGQGILLFFIAYSALRSPTDLRAFAWAFVAGAFVAAALGMIERSEEEGRLVGTIGDANFLAAILVPALVVAGFLLLTSRSLPARVILVPLTSVIALSLFMTQSRGGLVALGVSFLAGLAIGGRARARVLVALLVISATGFVYYGFFASTEARHRVTSYSAESSAGRSDLWAVALREFETKPITGFGAGNFVAAKPGFALESVNISRLDRVVDDPVIVHNTYLEVLAELGSVGLLLLASVLAGSLLAAWRGIRTLERHGAHDAASLARGIVIATIGILAAFVFLSAQYEKSLWLLLAASAASWSIARRLQPVASPIRPPAALGLTTTPLSERPSR
jgi:O-antigen ligase